MKFGVIFVAVLVMIIAISKFKVHPFITLILVAMAVGLVTGMDLGFVILSPISRALAQQSNKSLAVMATALSGGLYATHCLVPPTPGPIAIAGAVGADLGLTILVGLVFSIIAIIAVMFYAKYVASHVEIPANTEFTMDELIAKFGKLPGVGASFLPLVLPIAEATQGLLSSGMGVLVPFAISALLKLALGSSTVAMVTTAGMIAPLVESMGYSAPLARVFLVMAIGAGAMVASHANDSYFWVVSQFSDMKTSDAYRCQTGVSAFEGIVVVICLYIASMFLI